MAELFREVTERERKLYYTREWSAKKLPGGFILKTLENREFGFDHTGRGGRATERTSFWTSATLRTT